MLQPYVQSPERLWERDQIAVEGGNKTMKESQILSPILTQCGNDRGERGVGWRAKKHPVYICEWYYMHYCMMHTHFYPLQEMRFLTKRLRDKDEEDVVVGDWKFAAMVIDRCSDSIYVLYDLWEYVWALISMIPLEWCIILVSMYHYYFHWNVHWERLTIID